MSKMCFCGWYDMTVVAVIDDDSWKQNSCCVFLFCCLICCWCGRCVTLKGSVTDTVGSLCWGDTVMYKTLGGNGNESVPSIDPCWESQILEGHALARLTETDLFLLPLYTRHTRISLSFSPLLSLFFFFTDTAFIYFGWHTSSLHVNKWAVWY